jgi:hypothetical protein
MRRMRWSSHATLVTSVAALVVANLVPLYGVLYRGWSLHLVLIMYWVESGVIGALNVPKIAMAQGGDDTVTFTVNGRPARNASRTLVALFFVFHYGVFWVVHGVFVFLLPVFAGLGSQLFPTPDAERFGSVGFGAISVRAVGIGALCLALSHGLSFVVNYLWQREYLSVSPGQQMFSVYGRVVVLHVTILGGAFLIGGLGTPLAALGILIAAKIVIDIGLHLREHRRAQTPGPVAAQA